MLRVLLVSDGPGVLEVPPLPGPRVAIYQGSPVRMVCKHGGRSHSGLATHGDIDIIPQGVPARWEMKKADTALVLAMAPQLLERVVAESGIAARRVEILDRFKVRDAQIEHIGWALMAEAYQGYPSGRLYLDSMATALAVHLVRSHSSAGRRRWLPDGAMPRHQLRQVLSYIEENLSDDLSLRVIAQVARMSVSHLKVTFRKSVGLPVHQYVIRRRVERAAQLLREGELPISQIALEAGFAHQSHLAQHMKKVLGASPKRVSSGHALPQSHPESVDERSARRGPLID